MNISRCFLGGGGGGGPTTKKDIFSFLLFLFEDTFFEQIWHQNIDFKGVLKKNPKEQGHLGFSRQHDLFSCWTPHPFVVNVNVNRMF